MFVAARQYLVHYVVKVRNSYESIWLSITSIDMISAANRVEAGISSLSSVIHFFFCNSVFGE